MLTHPRSQDRGQPQLRATAQAQGDLKARSGGLPPLDLDGNPAALVSKSADDHALKMLLRLWGRR